MSPVTSQGFEEEACDLGSNLRGKERSCVLPCGHLASEDQTATTGLCR